MNSLLTPITLIVLAVALFFSVTDKQYEKVKALKIENAEYEEAIENSKALLRKRDELLGQYNSFSQQDLRKLNKLVPDSIDNVRLIIDINSVTAKYGVEIQNLKLDSVKAGASTGAGDAPAEPSDSSDTRPYRSAALTFSVSTDYETFIKILKDLEASLRILDVTNVTFNATDTGQYTYNITIQTYWMK